MKAPFLVIAVVLAGCGGSDSGIAPANDSTMSGEAALPGDQMTSGVAGDIDNPESVAGSENPITETPTSVPTTTAPSTDSIPLYPETPNTPAPANITLAVYSDNTAELNWTRPFYSDGIETNEILRDGVLLATIPGGGNSFVDSNRIANQGYRYEIVAINRFGRASSIFIDVGLSAAGGAGEPIDASGLPAELSAALDTAFDLFSAAPFKKIAATIFRLDDPLARDLRLISAEPDPFVEGSNQLTYACPQGGTWLVTEWGDDEEHVDIEALACSVGAITVSGRGQLRTSPFSDGTIMRYVLFSNVDLLDTRDNSRITLEYSYAAYDPGSTAGFAIGDELSVTGSAGHYTAESFNLRVNPGDPIAINLTGEIVLGGLADESRLRSREPLLLGSNGYPASGAVIIAKHGTNDESYDIVAGNGNPATFTFTATLDGVTTAYEIPWSMQRNVGGLDLSTVDIGF